VDIECAVCLRGFSATRKTAKYCSATCRSRARRSTPTPPDDTPTPPDEASGLVAGVRADLAKAGVLDTYSAQLALTLAKQIVAEGATGISSLSKELRVVMGEALAGARPQGESASGEPEDEVQKAREARERKARNAAG
jgi:hypothetical protein